MIPLKKSNRAIDLPFLGNFEKDQEKIHKQESVKIRQYIQNNLAYVGEIENFLIYEK